VLWEHSAPGIVTDVVKTPKGAVVAVKSVMPMTVGDKLSGRFGDKGTVSTIVPDSQMPVGEDGKPFEILLNPQGLISRGNAGQIIEAGLGRIARKTGQPYKLVDFTNDVQDWRDYAEKEMEKHGLSMQEAITDPRTGQRIPDIYMGERFFMKLHHTAESKGAGRSTGGYTAEELPARGGDSGSKRLALMSVHALLSSGATEVLRDAKLIRGQKNPEFWTQFMLGNKPATPRVPLIYEKFVDSLRGAGINVVRDGSKTHLMALTDKDIDHLAGNRELQNAETVDWQDYMKPKVGGLFDARLTGGHGGRSWAKITLHEPMPSPVFEELQS
jgi:DNA-directed RNA polymerase subunit beta